MDIPVDELIQDIERVRRISIVPTLLDIICESTGMGFAAVARVTKSKWITCSMRDDIQFGLTPGSELELKTTICDEIRDSHQPVVIDHVSKSELFCNHHTPLMYGFQSYISYPIILKTGEFFGTLCAIDPKPANLENARIQGMFTAFADLISFHLQQIELLDESDKAVRNLSRQLVNSMDENRQYQHISSHSLQEPLRKLKVFSGMVLDAIKENDIKKAEYLAARIDKSADRFSSMIRNLSDFTHLDENHSILEQTNLNTALQVAYLQLSVQLKQKQITVHTENLPVIKAFPAQIEQLFYHLIHNALKFSRDDVDSIISISSRLPRLENHTHKSLPDTQYLEISIKDNGIGIEADQVEKIFDMFSQLSTAPVRPGEGFGLTYCRKIIRNHNGQIRIESELQKGTTVLILLPIQD